MKNYTLLICIFLSAAIGFSFNEQTNDCANAYFNKEGYVVTVSMYDSTGKADGRRESTVTEVEMIGDTLFTNVTLVSASGNDKPDRKLMRYRCVNNMYSLDGKCILAAMNSEIPLAYVRFTEMKLDMPQYDLKIKAKDSLPDSDFRITFQTRQSFGVKLPPSRVVAIHTNRVCTGIDTLIVAGMSCVAYVIESDFESNILAARQGMNIKGRIKEWFSPLYGVIRSEYYEKGKLSRYELATAIKLPQ